MKLNKTDWLVLAIFVGITLLIYVLAIFAPWMAPLTYIAPLALIVVLALMIRRRDRSIDRQIHTMNYQQLERTIWLSRLIEPRIPLPPQRRGAASPDLLALLYQEIIVNRPRCVLECGAGVSTLWIGYTLEQLGAGRLITLEHDPLWANRVHDWVADHGLSGITTLIEAPLEKQREIDGADEWYAIEGLRAVMEESGTVDLLFVDGPPGHQLNRARLPAVSILKQYLSDHCVIILDDTQRAGEHSAAIQWGELLNYQVEFIDTDKGTAILRPTHVIGN